MEGDQAMSRWRIEAADGRVLSVATSLQGGELMIALDVAPRESQWPLLVDVPQAQDLRRVIGLAIGETQDKSPSSR